MFRLQKECNFSVTDKLLYDVLQEIKQIKQELNNIKGVFDNEGIRKENNEERKQIDGDNKRNESNEDSKDDNLQNRKVDKAAKVLEVKKYTCKVCGKEHANKGQMLACLKKHKKEAKK